MIIVFIFLFLSCRSSSFCMGTGGINKRCIYDNGKPIVGAKVYIEQIDQTIYTNSSGWANFTNLGSGPYTIYVDMDNDGNWDGVPDIVVLGQGEVVNITNDFPPPLVMQKLKASIKNNFYKMIS